MKKILKFLLIPAGESAIEKKDVLSERSIERLRKALELYREEDIDFFLVSGGIFYPHSKPVGVLMKEWLLNHGINNDSILVEEKSLNIFQEVKISTSIVSSIVSVKQRGHLDKYSGTITVVGDEWYLKRLKTLVVKENISFLYVDSGYKLNLFGKMKESLLFSYDRYRRVW